LLAGAILRKDIHPGKGNCNNGIVDAILLVSFLLAAASGLYFLFTPKAKGDNTVRFLFSPVAWDNLHTWSGIVFISVILVHLVLHWKWISKVTPNVFRGQNKAALNLQFGKITKE